MVLDIGTEAVKAAVFEREGRNYRILGSALEYFGELRPFDNDKVILKAKEEAMKWSGKSPKELLVSFSPNILKSRLKKVAFNRKNPEKIITQDESKIIIENAIGSAEKEIALQFTKKSGILPQDIKFVDAKVLESKINGYEISDISGSSGKDLEFKVLASFLPQGYLKDFNEAQVMSPIKNLYLIGISDGVFLDVGGDVTQMCLIKDGNVEIIDEIDLGSKNFSSAISKTLGMRDSEARFFKERYSKGELSDDARERTKEILSNALLEWQSALKLKLEAIKGLIPSTFYLFGGGSLLPDLKELIEGMGKEVKFIYSQDFKNIIDNTGCLDSPQFTNLILLLHG